MFIRIVYTKRPLLRTLIWTLCWLMLGPPALRADVEIYANGKKFKSMQAYTAYEKAPPKTSVPIPAKLSGQQKDYVRQKARELGLEVDFNKVKTFQISRHISPADLHRLYVMSIENGMVSALRDFYRSWAGPDHALADAITAGELEAAIRKAVTSSQGPKLLISEPGKVRIMALSPNDLRKTRQPI